MFVYNFREDKLPNISSLQTNINTELFILKNQIKTTDEKEEKVYKNFINLSIHSYLNFDNASILNDFNNAFSSSSEILEKLNAQKIRLESIQHLVNDTDFEKDFNQDDFLNNLQSLLEDYYDYKNSIQEQVIKENNRLNKLIKEIDKHDSKPNVVSNFIPFNDNVDNNNINTNNVVKTNTNDKANNTINESVPPKTIFKNENIKSKNNKKEKNKSNTILDNRLLLISEKDGKVYLPYYATDLQQTLLKSNYETVDELIENDYIFPLKKYKNAMVSRFREGYKLMREKEYESFASSFSFGLKLMNNYKLHPAVISACRNIDELNCFLDSLDDESLATFDIFDIKFDAPPIKK